MNKPTKNNNQKQAKNNTSNQKKNGRSASRSQAIRAQRRNVEDAQRIVGQYYSAESLAKESPQKARRANVIDDSPRLKVIALGGMDGGGSKNMIIVEYMNDAIVMDCGNDLGVDLPGINYAIADITYLESIKNKVRGYVITHGHLDHIGGLPHIVPRVPAPIYGSRFTIGMIEKIFENTSVDLDDFEMKTVIMNEVTHERLKIGSFFVELVRITHSIPGSTCIVVDSPVGRIINTGDFRLDPNPLDHEKTDTERLKQLGKEGVLLLMSDSTTAERIGRTPSESTIEQSFINIFDQAPGRVFVSLFSSNINRIQMLVNAATHHGRKIVMDGRSMMSTLEVAVKLGMIKIPKGTFVPISGISKIKDQEVVVICTGSQGEPNAALVRMSTGDHQHVKMKEQDTVVLSSTPIPESGNDALVGQMVDDLMKKGVHVFRHATRETDGCGPLHVSGHASLDEYGEMIDMVKPRFFVPIYGPYRAKQYHIEEAVRRGVPRKHCINAENGEVIALTKNTMAVEGNVPHGTILVDQSGSIVSNIVVKDRLMLAEEGLVALILTIDKKTNQLLTSPDIITRGFIYIRDSEELMTGLRSELKRAVTQRYGRIDIDRFKQELKDHITHYLYEQTQHSPIIIPVVNIVGGKSDKNGKGNSANGQNPQKAAQEQQKRFAQMRAKLLNQDARTD